MKKIKVLGIGNENNLNYIIIKKQNNFFKWLEKFLSSLGSVFPDVETYRDIEDGYTTFNNKKT